MKRVVALSLLSVLGLASCDSIIGQSSSFSLSSVTATSGQSSQSQSSSKASSSSYQSSSEASSSSQKASSSSSLSSPSSASSSSAVSSKSSSESSSLSSLDDEDYCDVSIYQYYKVADYRHQQGEVRFDLVIQVERDVPLYSSTEERRLIEERLSPNYMPHGDGYWYCMDFYTDVECTTFYISGTPILSDISLYYYCGG